MEIRKHHTNNHTFGAPSDMQDGSCAGLPVTITQDEFGHWANSFWQPSMKELAALAAGGCIVLSVRGPGHPVVAVGVTPDVTEPHAQIDGKEPLRS